MTITLNNQTAYNDRTGDETTLSGDFAIIDFKRSEVQTGRWTSEQVLTWTVSDGTERYGFTRTLDSSKSGRADFGTATEYDRTNI